jgi:hypothetical protein
MFAVVDREKGAGTEVWSSDDDGVSWAQRNTAPTGFNNSSVPCGGSSSAARAPGDAPMFVATASGVLYHAGGTLRSSAVANEDVCPALSDVFRSIDAGATWDRIADAAPWPPRSYGTMFALGERIYVIGGRRIPCVPSTADHSTCNFNDAWSSVDGIAWVRELPFAPWQARSKMSAEVVKYDADTGVGTVALLTGEELWYDSDTCSSFPENQCTRYAADVWLASVSQARPAGAGSGDADHLPVIDVVVCTAASLLSAVALIATVFVAALARRRCNQVAVSPHSSVGSTPAERSMLVAPFAQDFDAAQLWGVGDGDGSEESNVTVDRIMERTETGTAVDARFAGRLRYFLATVTAARLIDGVEVLDLLYEDSDRETGVGWEYVRLRGEMLGGDDGTTPLAVGDQCEALFGGAEQWYGAVVAVAHDDGTYDLAYDDGDEELRVSRAYIRAAVVAVVVGQEQMQQGQQVLVQSQPSSVVIGSRIEANFGARGQWFPGTVQSVSDGGGFQLFSVLYDDGDVEDRVAVMDLREPSDAAAAAAAAVAVAGSHIVGDSVEGNFGGRGTYFHATISAVHDDDGTYDLKYADGDEEQRVDPSCIRISGDASAAAVAASGSYSVGDFVEGDFGGRGMHFRATISAVHEDDGTSYDLKYADGDEEQRVDPSFIRMFG